MIKRLHVENYGLIARADVEFSDGATIFTGETGSGKTMLVGALAFALGSRADAALIGDGAQKTTVDLTFEPDAALVQRLRDGGIELDEGEDAAILRELTQAGKSSVRVCGRAVTAGFVREIAPAIAEIVGQHEAQRLLSASYHLEMLDRFAGAQALAVRTSVADAYERARQAREALAEIETQEKSATQRLEQARYALDEIRGAAPEIGEDERLTTRRRYLDNVERIATALRAANDALAGDEGSAVGALGAAGAALSGIRGIAPELNEIGEQLAALQSEANDLAASAARALEATEYDPGEIEAINARLDVLDRLKRKYGGTLEAVLAHGNEAEQIAGELERRDERAAELRQACDAAERELRANAERLAALRKAAASKLEERVLREFGDLALGSGSFVVAIEPLPEIGRNGAERAEFLFSANAGEAARPLGKIVSGGELSRVLLALVVALAEARERTALVFDEIDAGIGGATAVAVGKRIGRLARDGQLVCITHLAQLATWASRHYVLEKEEKRGTTTIAVREIEGKSERAHEIARMLSGETREAALKHARELLAQATT
jgi:DNA repair protein RecN (Recombination protein N)